MASKRTDDEVPAGWTLETEVPAGWTLEPKVPAGWTLKTEVQKDGSKKVLYSCSVTGQQFHTHADFTRYVRYAKKDRVGIYAPSNKSVKRKRYLKNNRKTSAALSIRRKLSSSNSNSLTAEKRTDSKSASSNESTDEKKNEDYVPELNGGDVAVEPDDVDRLLDDLDWGLLLELVYDDFCLA